MERALQRDFRHSNSFLKDQEGQEWDLSPFSAADGGEKYVMRIDMFMFRGIFYTFAIIFHI